MVMGMLAPPPKASIVFPTAAARRAELGLAVLAPAEHPVISERSGPARTSIWPNRPLIWGSTTGVTIRLIEASGVGGLAAGSCGLGMTLGTIGSEPMAMCSTSGSFPLRIWNMPMGMEASPTIRDRPPLAGGKLGELFQLDGQIAFRQRDRLAFLSLERANQDSSFPDFCWYRNRATPCEPASAGA